jgi:hypothetical protein
MAEQNRNTVLAVVAETTEGTPVAPTSGTQYLAVQEDFQIDPAFDSLENNELRSSLGVSKPILGAEHPKASFSHYFRHSGTEGTAPNFAPLVKALMGAQNANGTERVTDAASTTTLIKAAAGGADFARGRAVLVKDGSNRYSIRALAETSGTDLTPAFALPGAPAAGVGLGKCVSFEPANTGHDTLAVSAFRGNRSALEMLAGARVTSFSCDFKAGELINAKYELEGTGYYFNPIEIKATDTKLDFLDDAATRAATVAAGFYKDPHELAQSLEDAMNSLGSANTFSVTYSDTTGKFTFASTGATFSLLWNTGANTANTVGDKVGFSTAADDSGSLTYTSDNAVSFAAPQTPSYDAADPLAAKGNELLIGSQTDTVSIKADSVTLSCKLGRKEIADVNAESGISGSILNKREVTVKVVAILNQYDASKFKAFRQGDSVALQYSFGTKSGGNWVPGKCGCVFLPNAVIKSMSHPSNDGIIVMDMEIQAFVGTDGAGEFYLNFL